MKFLPIGIMAVSLISGYTLLQARVGSTEERVAKVEQENDEQYKAYAQINVSQAQLQSKLDSSYEILRDLKDSIKEMKKSK